MKASVDKNSCIGCQLCVADCPAVFAIDTDGFAKVIVDVVPADQDERCRFAAKECPVNAITVS
ncbi:MAG: ferredoxin [Chitinispirillaceae bacterium]|nr:ferredoxin [Chitinispirillaceae bacterium]